MDLVSGHAANRSLPPNFRSEKQPPRITNQRPSYQEAMQMDPQGMALNKKLTPVSSSNSRAKNNRLLLLKIEENN